MPVEYRSRLKKIKLSGKRVRNKVNIDPEHKQFRGRIRPLIKESVSFTPKYIAKKVPDRDTWYVSHRPNKHEQYEVGLIVKKGDGFESEFHHKSKITASSHSDLKHALNHLAKTHSYKRLAQITSNDNMTESVEINERVADVQERRKRAVRMRAKANILKNRRKILANKMPTHDRILRRAHIMARQIFRKKFAGQMGANYDTLSTSQKIMVDKMIEPRRPAMNKLIQRLVPKVRQAAVTKIAHHSHNMAQGSGSSLTMLSGPAKTPSASLKESLKESWDEFNLIYEEIIGEFE